MRPFSLELVRVAEDYHVAKRRISLLLWHYTQRPLFGKRIDEWFAGLREKW
jgi:hypothetical protein